MGQFGRRQFVAALGATALANPLFCMAQKTVRLPRVGYLSYAARSQGIPYFAAFRDGLTALGYVEGRTVDIEVRWAEVKSERMSTLATELIHALKVDVMVVTSCGALNINAVRGVSQTVPLVVAICGDLPGFMGEVASFARPGGNTTGQTIFAPELSAKRLELLRALVPKLSTVGVLWNPDSKGWDPYWREVRAAATALGIELQSVEVRTSNDFDAAFRKMEQGQAGAILTLTEPILFQNRRRIIAFARTRRVAAVYDFREFADDGGLISYGANALELIRRASGYVDKILKGAKPGDIPVERPDKLELVVNLKTAKALGITIPQSIMLRADKVIE